MLTIEQLCAANYYETIELWASGPHLHLEDFDYDRLVELDKKIQAHNLKLACFTPEQCVYAISVSHPDKVYRERTVEFFNRHIEAAVQLRCQRMVVSTGFAYLDLDPEDSFNWCVEGIGRICRKAEQEGVTWPWSPSQSSPPTSATRRASLCAL